MNKNQAVEIAKAVTPNNFNNSILRLEDEYFTKTKGASGYREEVLSNINPFVIESLNDEQKSILKGVIVKSDGDDEALVLALRAQMHEMFHDRMYYEMFHAVKVFFFVHAGNNLERFTSEEKKVEKALLTKYIEAHDGHPKVVVDGAPVNVSDGDAAIAINHMLNRVKPLPATGSPVWSFDPDVVAFGHPIIQPDEGLFPIIDEWFESLTDGKAFAAWIYAVAFTTYEGRDVPWIFSPNKVRKSLILNGIFGSIFGHSFQTISAPDIKAKNQFFSSQFENSRMAGILDCKNPKMIMDSFTHQLTGRDPIRIENKNEKIYSRVLDAALFITSNCRPEIDQDGSSVSRLFPITFKSKVFDGDILESEGGGGYFGETPNIVQAISEEVPAFLFWAEECYIELVDGIGYSFKFNEATMRLKDEAVARIEHKNIRIFTEHLTLNNSGKVPYEDLQLITKPTSGRSNQYDLPNFLEFLRKKYGFNVEGYGAGNAHIKGISLKEDDADFQTYIKGVK